MKSLASAEVHVSMVAIEDERIEAEARIGRQNARDAALARLRLLLVEQQEALDVRPYGFGHEWNVWALTVAIEQLQQANRQWSALSALSRAS